MCRDPSRGRTQPQRSTAAPRDKAPGPALSGVAVLGPPSVDGGGPEQGPRLRTLRAVHLALAVARPSEAGGQACRAASGGPREEGAAQMPLPPPIAHLCPQCFLLSQPASSAAALCSASPSASAPAPGAGEGAGSWGGGRGGGQLSCVSRTSTPSEFADSHPALGCPEGAPHPGCGPGPGDHGLLPLSQPRLEVPRGAWVSSCSVARDGRSWDPVSGVRFMFSLQEASRQPLGLWYEPRSYNLQTSPRPISGQGLEQGVQSGGQREALEDSVRMLFLRSKQASWEPRDR